jgi:hypothetical protein
MFLCSVLCQVYTSVGQFFDFSKNHWFWVVENYENRKTGQLWAFEILDFKELLGSGFLDFLFF